MSGRIYIAKSGAKNAPTLPLDAVTRTFGIFGMKDSGKTTAARVLVEGICKVGGHAVVVDPVGVWWGATRAGTGPGIKGVVLGGEHGDVPLEETGGKLVAELVLSRQYPLVVIDTNTLRKGARARFLADFLEELYFHNRRPLMVVFEEADKTLPQMARQNDVALNRVVGAAEDIVKLGRSRGLGATLISQRFATVNKNVTEQIESLLLLRIIGPNDRKAVKAWIESNGEAEVTSKVIDSMASLDQGEGWLYSPGWLRLLERVRLRASRTLDSSATPTEEEAIEQDAATRAPVSLDVLRTRMAETIERAKENDPGELRKRIRELEKTVADLHDDVAEARNEADAAEPETKLVYPWSDEEFDRAMQDAEDAMGEADDARQLVEGVVEHVADSRKHTEQLLAAMRRWRERKDNEIATLDKVVVKAVGNRVASGAGVAPTTQSAPFGCGLPPGGKQHSTGALPVTPMQPPGNDKLSGPQQRILNALAWWKTLDVTSPSRVQVAALAGTSSKSSGFERNLSVLRSGGYLDYPQSGRLALTTNGEALAAVPESVATQDDLTTALFNMVSGPQAAILGVLMGTYPDALSREELGEAVGVSFRSSGFERNLSVLRSFELADYPAVGAVIATPLCFVRN